MAKVVRMPKMTDSMDEGTLVKWHKKVGDSIKSGDIIAEIETDKAVMDFEADEELEGNLLHIGVNEGDSVPIDKLIAIIGKKGESFEALLKDDEGDSSKSKSESIKEKQEFSSDDQGESSVKAIKMPKMTDSMDEGTLVKWHKKVGDSIKSGDIVAEIETDKATMDFEADEELEGMLLYIGVDEGDSVPVDKLIAVIGNKGDSFEHLLKGADNSSSASSETSSSEASSTSSKTDITTNKKEVSTGVSSNENGRIKASPLAKRLAEEKGYDLSQINGSGENGRIVKRDIEAFEPSAVETSSSSAMPSIAGEESYQDMKVSQMRGVIAKRLAESKYSAPHFYLTINVDMDRAIEIRKRLNETSPVKLSFNDLVIKATAMALRKNPKVNASWLGDKIRQYNHIHIGMAVAIEDGLIVPVIRFADAKSLSQISKDAKSLGQKAKERKLQPAEWEGNTFTISNLGMFGIDSFTAIINPPDACILAVGGISQVPVVKNGELVPGNVMKLTLSCDHRVVDGAVGSAFMQTLKAYLEDPVQMLV